MPGRDTLQDFAGRALAAGRTRDEIRAALTAAGWSPREAADALDAWADSAFRPPVPRPRSVVSARDFFVYALLFIALGVTAYQAVQGAHALIDLRLPPSDPDDWRVRAAPDRLRWAVAALVVFGPLYAVLDLRTARARRDDPARHRSLIRKWTAALILLATILALLGTLTWVVFTFVEGGADLPFLLKAGWTGLVAAAIFLRWRGDEGGP